MSRFSRSLFTFLRDLEANNNRDWFQAHKEVYEDVLVEPSLAFVADFAPKLKKISPHFNAIPKKTGGSLFRIYRDTRFSKDKTPYKTHVGIQFRHKQAKDVHAPGFYLHIQPSGSFVGAGIWHPDGPTLGAIRSTIDADPSGWRRASGARLQRQFELAGDSLQRAPKGFDPDHPLIDDLKRKDFIAVHRLTQKQVLAADFVDEFAGLCAGAKGLVKWLCAAVDVPF